MASRRHRKRAYRALRSLGLVTPKRAGRKIGALSRRASLAGFGPLVPAKRRKGRHHG